MSHEEKGKQEGHGQGQQELSLEIATPKGIFTDVFPKTAKIAEVIQKVIDAQGLPDGDTYELVHNGTPLEPQNRPLVSFGIEDGAKLELVATGSGV